MKPSDLNELWTPLTQFFKERAHSQPEQLARATLNRIAPELEKRDISGVKACIWKEAVAISQESRGLETLLRCLDADPDCAAKKYVEIRSVLVNFFQSKDCHAAEDLTDRTLDRVAKILQRRKIDEVLPFIVGVGKNVLRESWKRPTMARLKSGVCELCCPSHELTLDSRRQYASLIQCIERLEPRDRELFRAYFMPFDDDISGKHMAEYRRDLAQRFGLTLGALRVKAHRLRSKVKRCCTSLPLWEKVG
jgi:hypothetical protein